MKTIELTKGLCTIVDDSDYEVLSRYRWLSDSKGYAARYQSAKESLTGKRRFLYMHRQIMGESKLQVDHINGDQLDNRRENLRFATHSENMRNRRMAKNCTSGYKGVYKKEASYVAYIKLSNSKVLAHTKTPQEAAYIYDQVALQVFGDFARTNIL